MTDDWIEVKDNKRQRQREKQINADKERNKWCELKKQAPHIILPTRAQRIRRKLNISLLDDMFLSDLWINHQLSGWRYVKIIKPDDIDGVPNDTDLEVFSTMPINNGYGDVALFKMLRPTKDFPE